MAEGIDCDLCREPGKYIEKLVTMDKKIMSNCKMIHELDNKVDNLTEMKTHLEYTNKTLNEIKKEFGSIKKLIEERYVPLDRFKLVEKVVYSTVALLLVAFVNQFFTMRGAQ